MGTNRLEPGASPTNLAAHRRRVGTVAPGAKAAGAAAMGSAVQHPVQNLTWWQNIPGLLYAGLKCRPWKLAFLKKRRVEPAADKQPAGKKSGWTQPEA